MILPNQQDKYALDTNNLASVFILNTITQVCPIGQCLQDQASQIIGRRRVPSRDCRCDCHRGRVRLRHRGRVRLRHRGRVRLRHRGRVRLCHRGRVRLRHRGRVRLHHRGQVRLRHHGRVPVFLLMPSITAAE